MKRKPMHGDEFLSGAGIILRVLADDPARQVRFVVPSNEQAAGFMAAGYARASGKVGVFMVTAGPGATNAAAPIADCNGDSVPVVF